MNKILILTLLLVACTEPIHLSNRDLDMARCICKKYSSELKVVRRNEDQIEVQCMDNKGYIHGDEYFTEGCSSR